MLILTFNFIFLPITFYKKEFLNEIIPKLYMLHPIFIYIYYVVLNYMM